MTLSVRNMDGERGAMLTQSAKVWTQRVRRPPFWLIVTAVDRNRSLPVGDQFTCYRWAGACPTIDILIEIKIQLNFAMHGFIAYSADHNEILHTSRQ